MSRQILVATNNWTGTDRRLLDQVGIVGDVSYRTMYPGGPSSLECTLSMPAISAPQVITPGRKVEIFLGGSLYWAGKLSDPVRGEPWKIAAVGVGSMANAYSADSTSAETAVGNAITRGLPWTKAAGALSTFVATAGDGSQRLDAMLTAAATGAGMAWRITPAGIILAETWPTAVTHLAWPSNVPEATMADYATAYLITYQATASTTATTSVSSASAATRFGGYAEQPLDLTGYGVISAATAQSIATNLLNQQAPTLTLSGPIVVQPGQLLTPTGAPVDLATVRAGIVVQVMTTDPGHSQLLDPTKPVTGVVVETAYDSVAETLSLSLKGEKRRDLLALLSGGARWAA